MARLVIHGAAMSRLSRRDLFAAAATAAVSLRRAASVAAPRPNARQVTARASRYVAEYDRQMTAIVAEEHYRQEMTELSVGVQTRELVSEIAWLRLARLGDAIAVRDVLMVDGRPLSHERRLPALLERADAAVDSMVSALLAESAAHNLGAESRNINFPTFPLVYLREPNVARSRWRLREDDEGRPVLQFSERHRPTIVRSPAGADMRGSGRFWIDDLSGRIERCEVRVAFVRRTYSFNLESIDAVSHEAIVTFAADEALALWVPKTMTDQFRGGQGWEAVHIRGNATYSNYRRFQTAGRVLPRVP